MKFPPFKWPAPRPTWKSSTASSVAVWCQESGPDWRRSRNREIHPAFTGIYPAFYYWHGPLCVGEESAQQIKLRAERLGDIDSEFYLYAETNMQSIRTEIEKIKPAFLIIDSIQTIMSPDISSVQGSVSQVREVTNELMQIAKTNNIATFIVGHMTKEGTLAGPRTLEHMVDTVLYFEGERQHTFRILRAVKTALAPPTKSAF